MIKDMGDIELANHITTSLEIYECDYNTNMSTVVTEITINNQTLMLANLIVLLRKKAIIIDDEIEQLLIRRY